MRGSLAWVALALALVSGPLTARAHGQTVQVSASGARPSQLTVVVGTTIHFHNANLGGSVCTIVADDGSFESPPLQAGEGWHHTFDEPGTFTFTTKEASGVRGTIVVAAPR